MSDDYLIRQTAPTLAGIKTGSLFTCQYESYETVKDEIRAFNRTLVKKGLRLIPLRRSETRVLLYLYRPSRLRNDLAAPCAEEILRREGYAELREDYCLCEIGRRLRRFGDFPHEIGLFLSYPPEDVKGFMENRGSGCKCVGCWKVYGDEARAKRLFRKYKRCTERYCRKVAQGKSIGELAVGSRGE